MQHNLTQKHMSLFFAVSAADAVTPYVLIHAGPKDFLGRNKRAPLKCYKTVNGYMDTPTFFQVMQDVIAKYVEKTREEHNLVDQYAVLVVDGHISRFSIQTIEFSISKNIHIVILPAHTSHVTQPMDLGLNHIIKDGLRRYLRSITPVIPLKPDQLEEKKPGRPPKTKPKVSPECALSLENECLLRARQEEPEVTEARVGHAAFERAKIISAVLEAIEAALTYWKIVVAWNVSHLYPLYDEPHYTEKQEQDLLQQVAKEDIHFLLDDDGEEGKRKRRKKKHLTGALTTESGFARVKTIIEGGVLEEEAPSVTVTASTLQGPIIVLADTEESDREVEGLGDYITFTQVMKRR